MKVVPCRNCGQTIWLIQDVSTGRSRPVNPEARLSRSAADGNIVLLSSHDDRGRKVTMCRQLDAIELAANLMHHRHMPHQAKCRPNRQHAAA